VLARGAMTDISDLPPQPMSAPAHPANAKLKSITRELHIPRALERVGLEAW
jgi:hypothetical protein